MGREEDVRPSERSCVVNSRPIPRVAPTISQVCGIGLAFLALGKYDF